MKILFFKINYMQKTTRIFDWRINSFFELYSIMQNNYTYSNELVNYSTPVPTQTKRKIKSLTKAKCKSRKKPIGIYAICASRAIKRFRVERKLSQHSTALEANLSASYLSNVERGNHSISIEKFVAIAFAIDGNSDRLFEIYNEELNKSVEKII